MSPCLLDVNVLVALAWPAHVHHEQCQRWFAERRGSGFATCPLTQTSFVRISSNPGFTTGAVQPREALSLLARVVALPEHQFWPDDVSLLEAIPPGRLIVGHRQINDAYLLGLARKHGGRLATLDRGVRSLVTEADALEMIQG